MNFPNPVLTTAEAAALVGVSPATLRVWRHRGLLPYRAVNITSRLALHPLWPTLRFALQRLNSQNPTPTP